MRRLCQVWLIEGRSAWGKSEKMSSEKVKRALKTLLKHEDNKFCADCPQKKPTWASINLGVFLCLHCAGIHRDMGVHISKVRSVELDTWQPEWVKVMQKWGNRRANKYWEATMPANYPGRPSEAEAQALSQKLKKFIRDKYEKKTWAAKSMAGIFDDAAPHQVAKPAVKPSKPRRTKTKPQPTERIEAKPAEEEVDLFGSFEGPQTSAQPVRPAAQPTPPQQPQVVAHNAKAANIMAMFQKNAAPQKPLNVYNAPPNAPFNGMSSNGMQQINPGFPQMPYSGQQTMQQPAMNQAQHGNVYSQGMNGMQPAGQPAKTMQASANAWPQQMMTATPAVSQMMQQNAYRIPVQQGQGTHSMQMQMRGPPAGQVQMPGQRMPVQGMPVQQRGTPTQVPQMPSQSMPQSNQVYDPFASLT